MADDQTPQIRMPSFTLDQLAAFGALGLLYPPPQSIIPGVRSYMNYPYALVMGHRLLRLDLHIPENLEGPTPVVVYASGGGWRLCVKHHSPWLYLLSEGYAVASIEYRLSVEATFPAAVHDVKATVRWLRARADGFSLDRSRVAAYGSSAGGYLVSFAAATNGLAEFEGKVGDHLDESSDIACVIDHFGLTDFATCAEDTNSLPGVVEPFGGPASPDTLFLGYPPNSRPEETARAAIATYVSAKTVPFLIMHGDADTRLGIGQSRRLHEALQAVGADVEFYTIPGANHGTPEFDSDEARARGLAFLRRVFGPGASRAT